MTKTYIERNKYLSTYSKNKVVTDSFIQKYRGLTRSTVEHILQLSECVVDIKQKEKSGELNCYDIQYFCHSVGITEKGSTFRKFMCIGQRVEDFRHYLDKLPNSYTVLYEITTLDPDLFEQLMTSNQLHSYVTLKDVKLLGNKIKKTQSDDVSFTVTFDKKVNQSTKESLVSIIMELSSLEEVTVEVPKKYQSFLPPEKMNSVPRICS